jgi:hypothetical protein
MTKLEHFEDTQLTIERSKCLCRQSELVIISSSKVIDRAQSTLYRVRTVNTTGEVGKH